MSGDVLNIRPSTASTTLAYATGSKEPTTVILKVEESTDWPLKWSFNVEDEHR
jgi:hypothetical protein